jgi:hypothetical protein
VRRGAAPENLRHFHPEGRSKERYRRAAVTALACGGARVAYIIFTISGKGNFGEISLKSCCKISLI